MHSDRDRPTQPADLVSLRDVRILWLGLGQLGRALSQRLAAAGLRIQGVDPKVPTGLPFDVHERFEGMSVQCSVMAACLPTVKDLLKSIEYALSLPDYCRPNIIINFSTIGPKAALEAAGMVRNTKRAVYIEAPVSGGVLRARDGNISIFWGSDDSDHRDLTESILGLLARTVIRMPSVAAASGVKLINNFLAIANSFTVVEGLRLGKALGLSPEATRELLENGTADSYVLRSTVKRPMVTKDATTGFVTRLALKDMLLLRDAIGEISSELLDSIVEQLICSVDWGYSEKVFPMAMIDRHLGTRQLAGGEPWQQR